MMSLSNSCLKLVLHVYIHVTSTKCTCHGLYEKLHTCTLKCFVGLCCLKPLDSQSTYIRLCTVEDLKI